MLQQGEYDPLRFAQWVNRTPNLTKVMHRQKLVWTGTAKALALFGYLAWLAPLVLAASWAVSTAGPLASRLGIVLISSFLMPLWGVVGLFIAATLGRLFIYGPKERKQLRRAEELFARHPATKIAIAGSYGKTTLKEMLAVILSEGKKVAATPGNQNVAISHARWAAKLSGHEEVLIIEYGEGTPGDIARFASTTHPSIGIITGLAPNHLDKYKTLENVAKDLLSLSDYLENQNIFVNGEDKAFKTYIRKSHEIYDQKAVVGWQISDVSVGIDGTKFVMKKGKRQLNINSGLLGRHQVASLALCAAIADRLGLSKEQIEAGAAKTIPFEHRMQPMIIGGAWVIDDAYNGNIEGIRAGLELLKELSARRKIYVSPGLVDQGEETERVHLLMGKLIAEAKPDKVVLMENSVADFIETGMKTGGFNGELVREPDPLGFYSNLDQFVAVGDLVMLQNDWTDIYN